MINTLLITHTKIATSLLDVTLRIYPISMLNYKVIEIDCCDNKKYYQQKYNEGLNSLRKLTANNNPGCLILSDLYGATPYNIAQKLAIKTNNYLISGVSLAMLLKLFNYSNEQQLSNNSINYHHLANSLALTAQETIIYKNYANVENNKINHINSIVQESNIHHINTFAEVT